MRLPLRRLPLAGSTIVGRTAPDRRQKAKGKNELPCRKADTMFNAVIHPKFLPFGFCRRARKRITRHILPFAFKQSVHDD